MLAGIGAQQQERVGAARVAPAGCFPSVGPDDEDRRGFREERAVEICELAGARRGSRSFASSTPLEKER